MISICSLVTIQQFSITSIMLNAQTIEATPKDLRTKRSFSYNDLKKKRLIQSQKSKSKMRTIRQEESYKKVRTIPKTQIKHILSTIPKNETTIEQCISQLHGVLSSLRQKSKRKRMLSIRQSLTQRSLNQRTRIRYDSQIIHRVSLAGAKQKLSFYNSIEHAGQAKEMIKGLISKNKSMRKFTKLNQIRDKLKMEKQKSNTRSIDISNDNIIENKLGKVAIPQKYAPDKQNIKGRSNGDQTNKQQSHKKTIKQISTRQNVEASDKRKTRPFTRSKSIREIVVQIKHREAENEEAGKVEGVDEELQNLINAVGEAKQIMMIAETQVRPLTSCDVFQSHPNAFNQVIVDISSIADNSRQTKFNQSELDMLNTHQYQASNDHLLDLLKVKTSELRKMNKCKQNKKRSQLQRIKKIFPKNFFGF